MYVYALFVVSNQNSAASHILINHSYELKTLELIPTDLLYRCPRIEHMLKAESPSISRVKLKFHWKFTPTMI